MVVWCHGAPGGQVLCSLTGAALNGPHGGGGAWRGGGPQGHALVVLGAALLNGPHIAVAPHAEAAGHRQVQGFHRLRLQLAEHRFAHGLELPIHFHLAHLRAETGYHDSSDLAEKKPLLQASSPRKPHPIAFNANAVHSPCVTIHN